LDNKVFDIIDARCNHEVQLLHKFSQVPWYVVMMNLPAPDWHFLGYVWQTASWRCHSTYK